MPAPRKKTLSKKKKVKKVLLRKTALRTKKKALRRTKPVIKTIRTKPIGLITHFYRDISVAVAKFSKPVSVGETIHIMGATTDFSQPVASLQYDHTSISKAPKGKLVGLKVKKRVRQGDKIFAG